jgi:hypothetical protein
MTRLLIHDIRSGREFRDLSSVWKPKRDSRPLILGGEWPVRVVNGPPDGIMTMPGPAAGAPGGTEGDRGQREIVGLF